MFKKINVNHAGIVLFALILLVAAQLSYADGDSFTVNIPNTQGGYTSIVIRQSGSGYLGPQGEYYTQFPSVTQLQSVYDSNTAPSIITTDNDNESDASISVTIAPPDLPDYDQPDAPGPDYIWTPGYWGYDSFFQDYYWVPGTWVVAPTPGYLWTPGYWYWRNGQYIFSEGYWGPHVGFYGGICYGYGYQGRGYLRGDHRPRGNNAPSFNGGPGGTKYQPTHDEQVAMKERHVWATPAQRMQVQAARTNPALRASENHGKPSIAATAQPGVFKGRGVVVTKQAGTFYNNTKPIKSNVTHLQGAVKPVVQKLVTEKPVVKKPVVQKPAAQEPAVKQPVVEQVNAEKTQQAKNPSSNKDDSKNKYTQYSN